jgi:hypothetical protein
MWVMFLPHRPGSTGKGALEIRLAAAGHDGQRAGLRADLAAGDRAHPTQFTRSAHSRVSGTPSGAESQ